MEDPIRCQSWCQNCCMSFHPDMLTGYCLIGLRCDKCCRTTDLAMVVVREVGDRHGR